MAHQLSIEFYMFVPVIKSFIANPTAHLYPFPFNKSHVNMSLLEATIEEVAEKWDTAPVYDLPMIGRSMLSKKYSNLYPPIDKTAFYLVELDGESIWFYNTSIVYRTSLLSDYQYLSLEELGRLKIAFGDDLYLIDEILTMLRLSRLDHQSIDEIIANIGY